MSGISRFEEIEGWRKGRELARLVYQVSARPEFARDFGLSNQIRRSAVSVLSNIAEGFERGGNGEFRYFLSVAKGSAGEVQAQLYVALDAGFISQSEFEQLYKLARDTSRLIGGFMRFLQRSALEGPKFKMSRELDSV
jgi:four helix bundle protein